MRDLAKNSFIVSSSRYAMLGFAIIRNFTVARLLGPEDYAYWLLFLIALNYADQIHLGLRFAGDRQLPLERGRGNPEEVARLTNALFGGTISVSFLAVIIIGGVGFYLLSVVEHVGEYDSTILINCLLMTAAIAFFDQIGRFYIMLFRSRKNFFTASGSETIYEGGKTLLVVLLGWSLHLYGAIAAHIIPALALAGYFWLTNRRDVRPVVDYGRFRLLFGIGFPLLVSNIAALAVLNADRIAAGILFTPTNFSYYGFAATMMLIPVLAANALREVFSPTFAERYGATGDEASLFPLLNKATQLVGLAAPILVLVTVASSEIVIPLLLPKFAPSLLIMSLLANAVTFLIIASIPSLFFIIVGRMRIYILLQLASIATAGLAFWLLATLSEVSILVLAASVLVLFSAFSLLSFVAAYRFCRVPWNVIAGELLVTYLPTLLFLVFNVAFTVLHSPDYDAFGKTLTGVGLRIIIFSLVYAPVAYFINRTTGMTQLLRTLIQKANPV